MTDALDQFAFYTGDVSYIQLSPILKEDENYGLRKFQGVV